MTLRLGRDGHNLGGLSDQHFVQGYGRLPDFYRHQEYLELCKIELNQSDMNIQSTLTDPI